jgi:hypothetical protein
MLTLEDKADVAREILNALKMIGGIRNYENAQMEILKVLQGYNMITRQGKSLDVKDLAKAFNLENS